MQLCMSFQRYVTVVDRSQYIINFYTVLFDLHLHDGLESLLD